MKRFCAVLAGLVFFVAGVFKLTDPVGSSLVVDSYLGFFHLGFLSGLSGLIGFVLSLTEALLGLALLTEAFKKIASRLAIGLTGFFTVLTFILLLANPVMECGCFGEAVHLSHGQTFIKNLILCALVGFSCLPLPTEDGPSSSYSKKIFAGLGSITLALAIYSLFFLPLWDFTNFGAGDRLYDASSPFPPVKASEPGFIYEKDGVEKEFSLDALPDSTWNFVRQAQVAQTAAPLNFIPVTAPDGGTADSLLLGGRIMVVSVNDADAVSTSRWASVSRFLSSSAAHGFRPVVLAASAPEAFEKMLEGLTTEDRLQLLMTTYYSDHKVLMTLNRSNGGAVLLDDGLIADKWSKYSLPSADDMASLAQSQPGTLFIKASMPGRLVLSLFIVLAIFVALYTHRRK